MLCYNKNVCYFQLGRLVPVSVQLRVREQPDRVQCEQFRRSPIFRSVLIEKSKSLWNSCYSFVFKLPQIVISHHKKSS